MKFESEKVIEARLRDAVEKRGGICLKFTSQYHRGMPDRICLFPSGVIYFVELKSTGKRPTVLQKHAMRQLGELGFRSFVIDTTDGVEAFIANAVRDITFSSEYMTVHTR